MQSSITCPKCGHDEDTYTDWLNSLMENASESFDGDEAMEAIVLRYIHALELGHGDTALWDALHEVFPEEVPASESVIEGFYEHYAPLVGTSPPGATPQPGYVLSAVSQPVQVVDPITYQS